MESARIKKYDWAAVAFACVLPSVVTLVYYVVAPWLGAEPESVQRIYAVAKFIQFTFPLVWVFGFCREPLRGIRWNGRGFGIGLAFGCLAGAVIWGGYHFVLADSASFTSAAGEVREKVEDVGLDVRWKYVAVGIFYTLVHSLLEEYYWRWFAFGRMRNWMSLPAAIAFSSVAFMAHHVILLGLFFGWTSPLTWLFSVGVMTGGAFWAWLYDRSGNLWGPWFSHALIDAAIFSVGYRLTFN